MLKRFVAVVMLFSTVLVTTPISAAELAAPKTSLGSVSSVGTVNLRGVSVPQEGTIFNGDELQVGSQGYAKVMLVAGHRLELDRDTRISVGQPGKNVVVQVKSGNVGFSAAGASQLTLSVGPYEIVPDPNAAGNVALIGKDALGLRTIRGKINVHQLTAAHISYVVAQGQERILTYTGQTSEPVTQIASALPAPIPTVPPAPDPQTAPAGKSGLSKTGWIAILATVAGATAAIAVLATRNNNENSSVILSRQQAVQGTQNAINSAQLAISASTQVQAAATQGMAALSTLPPSTQTTLNGQFQNASSQASAAGQQISQTILPNLNNLSAQLNSATSTSQIQSLETQINAAIAQLNTQIQVINAQIAAVIATANTARSAGANVPAINISPTPTVPPITASPTTP
jgi:hypothetical protein